ncbi:PREDICTED: BEL1-like homeodomain protein 2 isoform X2 [Ipomoea nil]|uniref:BEL1-like homeodomain protein 2 isoform X2 n=1 Tax=Ipomoea nil TaxID=35883 RepID=UPI000900AA74|nr:PREDICTED: BEL1-like homeodomain protein 2 isoform X2 [Ipomoea nil]
MSQDYHHHPGLFSFSNGFERSPAEILQQIRRDKVPPAPPQQVEEEDEHPVGLAGSNETSGMLSEMFNFQHGTARELLESQIYHHHHGQQSQPQMAAAMQLFGMNPSPSPSPSSNHSAAAASTFHVSSVPNPSPTSTLQGFHSHAPTGGHFSQFAWGDGGTAAAAAGEGQGLSLSLSSAKAGEEFRISGDAAGMLFFSQGMASASSEYPCKNNLNLNGGGGGGGGVMDHHHIHVGFGSSIGVINGLRHSKYAKPAQELLDEFCSVVVSAHHQFNNKNKSLNPNSNPTSSDAVDGGDAPNNNSSSSSKPTPPLSTADRVEHQRRKVKLLSMLDEVDRRYNRYCEQMQMVVNSFDLVMGFGAAAPYTVQAQKAMSRHFRCLKDAVAAQLKHSCEVLGEKDGGASSGLTKGETPRLKMLEQSLRQQRAFHQMGMMEPEAWRPQRGLPERSVNALRAWLFEHFLHPYPSDADKHMLARQTGLSRSQVSNWFINARVRLWKPMVEEMYQQEVKVGDSENMDSPSSGDDTVAVSNSPTTTTTAPPPPSAAAAVTATAADTVAAAGKRSEINAANESDPSLLAINTQCFSRNQASTCHRRGTADSGGGGNVSLTLGLRHAGNLPDQNHFFG